LPGHPLLIDTATVRMCVYSLLQLCTFAKFNYPSGT
jgi:hypothetical protein